MWKRAISGALMLGLTSPTAWSEDRQTTLKIGDPAPALNFRLISDGTSPSFSDFKGDYLFLDFWATWCPPCIKSVPHLNQLQARFKDRPVRFFSITYETEGMVEPFLKRHGLEVPVGLDNDFAMFKSYQAWGIPTMFVINPDREIVTVTSPFNITPEVVMEFLDGGTPELEQYKGWQDPEGAEKYFRSLLDQWKRDHP